MLDLQKIKEEITCIAVNSYKEYVDALCYGINCNIDKLEKEAKENVKLQFLADNLLKNPTCQISNSILCSIQDKIRTTKLQYKCNPDKCADLRNISCSMVITIDNTVNSCTPPNLIIRQ